MIFHVLRKSCLLAATAALCGILSAPSLAAPARKTFKLGSSVFTGAPKSICVIQGKWRDGELFRYETWDDCPSMRMRRATREELLASRSLGDSDEVPATVTPRTEIIELSNRFSRVLLYRDSKGKLREILVGD